MMNSLVSDDLSDIDSDDISESDEEDEEEIFAYIENFPVNMICLESCNNTLDDYMLNNEVENKEWCRYIYADNIYIYWYTKNVFILPIMIYIQIM